MNDNPLHLLCVEDSAAYLILLKNLLGQCSEPGFTVETCSCVRQATALLQERAFDVILLDINLPDSRGIQTFHQLQRFAQTTPILILTGCEDESLGVIAVRQGAQEYLVKETTDLKSLRTAIRHARERHRLLQDLHDANERYELASLGANDGLWDWDLKTNHIYFSERWMVIAGLRAEEVGNSPDHWYRRIYPQDLNYVRACIEQHVNGLTDHLECEYRFLHRDANFRWMLCRGVAVRDSNGVATRMVGSQTDITRIKMAEANLIHDAHHDFLTRLPNRIQLLSRLGRLLDQTRVNPEEIFALLFLDLDGFKIVNDSLGHALGDQLLITVARRLETCLRPGDLVSRIGGDEFAVLLERISDLSDALQISSRIHEKLAEPINLAGHHIEVKTSIGITSSLRPYTHPEEMLRDGDVAMYQAKRSEASGERVGTLIFDTQMHQSAIQRLELESNFRRALKNCDAEFILHYQPVVLCAAPFSIGGANGGTLPTSLQNKPGCDGEVGSVGTLCPSRICGLEALVRWQRPDGSLMPPSEFIPFAEKTRLVVPLGEHVLQKVCEHFQQWQSLVGDQPLPALYVNLSCRQLSESFVGLVRELLEVSRLPQGTLALHLELTESVLLDDTRNLKHLQDLRDSGVHLCIDDFGTGYSSLQYLRRSPFEIVKIDRMFIHDLLPNGENVELLRAIVSLASHLGLQTVAEGVEHEYQFRQLQELGCDYAQGFFLGKPIPAEDIPDLLQNRLKQTAAWGRA